MCTGSSSNILELSFTKSNSFFRCYWHAKSRHTIDEKNLGGTFPRKWISSHSKGGPIRLLSLNWRCYPLDFYKIRRDLTLRFLDYFFFRFRSLFRQARFTWVNLETFLFIASWLFFQHFETLSADNDRTKTTAFFFPHCS